MASNFFHATYQQPTIHIYFWSDLNQDWIVLIFTVTIFYPRNQKIYTSNWVRSKLKNINLKQELWFPIESKITIKIVLITQLFWFLLSSYYTLGLKTNNIYNWINYKRAKYQGKVRVVIFGWIKTHHLNWSRDTIVLVSTFITFYPWTWKNCNTYN